MLVDTQIFSVWGRLSHPNGIFCNYHECIIKSGIMSIEVTHSNRDNNPDLPGELVVRLDPTVNLYRIHLFNELGYEMFGFNTSAGRFVVMTNVPDNGQQTYPINIMYPGRSDFETLVLQSGQIQVLEIDKVEDTVFGRVVSGVEYVGFYRRK